jgi:hypothetical protein
MMKKYILPLLIFAGIIMLYQQSLEKPNLYITCLSFMVFVFCITKLSKSIPPKNEDSDDKV